MSGRFGQSALTLYSLAARLLGWRPQEFWNATPAELSSALASPAEHSPGMDRSELNLMLERDHGDLQ